MQHLLDDLFTKQFEYPSGSGQMYDCIPKDVDLEQFLEDYYVAMAEAGKRESDAEDDAEDVPEYYNKG